MCLNSGHFAFMSAYVQGLDTRERWVHCLSMHGLVTDVRVVKSEMRQLEQNLGAQSRWHAKLGIARLLEMEVQKLPKLAPASIIPPWTTSLMKMVSHVGRLRA